MFSSVTSFVVCTVERHPHREGEYTPGGVFSRVVLVYGSSDQRVEILTLLLENELNFSLIVFFIFFYNSL